MSAGGIQELDKFISGTARKDWEELKPSLESASLETRNEAYLFFSRLLKVSNGMSSADDKLKKLWTEFLEHGQVYVKDAERRYDFKNVLGLFSQEKPAFELKWIQMDPKAGDDEVTKTAKTIMTIAKESIGSAPPLGFLEKILRAPFTCSLIAAVGNTPIAASYGTYVEELNLIHVNFVGRKLDYPGVHILEQLQKLEANIRQQFPGLNCVTLCVQDCNAHAKHMYQQLGFEQIEYMEKSTVKGFEGEALYFYGKKLEDDATLPKNYVEFRAAYDKARAPYLGK